MLTVFIAPSGLARALERPTPNIGQPLRRGNGAARPAPAFEIVLLACAAHAMLGP